MFLFAVGVESALEEVYEAFNREVVAANRYEHFSVRGEKHVVWLGIYIPL